MSQNKTTFSSAVAVNDNSVVLASATGVVPGAFLRAEDEVMRVGQGYVSGTTVPVSRGLEGSVTAAHATSTPVVVELATDLTGPSPQLKVQFPIAGRARTTKTYAAAGAIALPAPGADAVAIIVGTSALAMTLANPTKDMDGCLLFIVGNGKSASTITYTAGFGNAGSAYDVLTLQTAGQVGIILMAANEIWVLLNAPLTGTTTALSLAIA